MIPYLFYSCTYIKCELIIISVLLFSMPRYLLYYRVCADENFISNDNLSSNYYVTRDSGCIVWRNWFLSCNLRFSEQGLGEWGLGSTLLSDSAFLESSL